MFFCQPNLTYQIHDTNIIYDPEYLRSPDQQRSGSQIGSPHLQSPTSTQVGITRNDTGYKSRQHSTNILSYFNSSGQRTKTIGIQTDYRDSECQTDPYTPQYVIKSVNTDKNDQTNVVENNNNNNNENSEPNSKNKNKQPAILDLQHLSYSKGTLPVGYDEIEALERETIKKQIIAALPNTNDPKMLPFRRKVLTQLEKSDWEYRESLMKKEQALRLNAIFQTMDERDAMSQEFEKEKLSKLQTQLYEDHNKLKKKIQMKRIKALRKIGNKHKIVESIIDSTIGQTPESTQNTSQTNENVGSTKSNLETTHRERRSKVEKKKLRKDLVSKYFDYASDVYVPKKIDGTVNIRQQTDSLIKMIKQQSNQEENTKSHYYATKKLNKLSTDTMKNITNTKNIDSQFKNIKQTSRIQQQMLEQLDHIDNVLGATTDSSINSQFRHASTSPNKTSNKDGKKFENVYKTFNPVIRPPTPKFEPQLCVKCLFVFFLFYF